jgi:hypothetical protein
MPCHSCGGLYLLKIISLIDKFIGVLRGVIVWISIRVVCLYLYCGGNTLQTEGFFIPSVTVGKDHRHQANVIGIDDFG